MNVKPILTNMKLITTTVLLFLSICSFGQRVFPDDFKKGGIETGSTFPITALTSLDQSTLDSTSFKNKLVYMNYWFVGCRGCRQEEELLKEIKEHFKGNDKVEFLSITPSTATEVRDYFKKFGDFGFQVYPYEGFKEVKRTFNVKTFPHHQLIRNGVVVENLGLPIAREEWKEWMIGRINEEINNLE